MKKKKKKRKEENDPVFEDCRTNFRVARLGLVDYLSRIVEQCVVLYGRKKISQKEAHRVRHRPRFNLSCVARSTFS